MNKQNIVLMLLIVASIVTTLIIVPGFNLTYIVIISLSVMVGTYGIVLANQNKLVNFTFNAISCLLFSVIYVNLSLYAMGLTYLLFLLPLQIHGIRVWSLNKNEMLQNRRVTDKIKIRRMKPKFRRVIIAAFVLISLIMITLLYFSSSEAAALFGHRDLIVSLDGIGAIGNVFGQLLMNLRYIEAHIFWIIINISQIILFLHIIITHQNWHLFPVLIMYVVWLIYSLMTLREYYRSLKH